MALGTSDYVRDWPLKLNEGQYLEADTYTATFLSDTYASINLDATNPQLSDYTQTTGGNIVATNLVNFTISRATTTITFDADDLPTFAKDAANPTDVRVLLIFNNTSTNDDAAQIIDLTTDGTTPPDLVNNDLTINFNVNGIMTATLT